MWNAFQRFVREEEGAQVVEYALVIALVSIVLAVALGNETSGIPSAFSGFVNKVKVCLGGTVAGVTCT